ncbi:MAG: class I SAM-dependent DNA methyltransferase [Myxococcales bacterium]
MALKLPTGLEGCYHALTSRGDSRHVIEQMSTLAWLRILTDAGAPKIGGHDPRTILSDPISWPELVGLDNLPVNLTVFCARLCDVMGDDLLWRDWHELEPAAVGKACLEMGRWQMPEGDPLGFLYTHLVSPSKRAGLGSFFTPYHVSLMMAMMLQPKPGESVMDPCCGSAGMLLAALEACRKEHGPDAVLEIYGMDIDGDAVRLAKLNLALAGIAPGRRVVTEDESGLPPEKIAELKEQAHGGFVQGNLFE